jgi:SET domain-containing protein
MPTLKKQKSKIHGSGIFAEEKIPKDFSFYTIPLGIIHKSPKPRCARIGEGRYVDDEKILNWINHSCDPNAKLVIDTEAPFLISTKEIENGEEVTVNYNETEKGSKKLNCKCKTKKCKGYFEIN